MNKNLVKFAVTGAVLTTAITMTTEVEATSQRMQVTGASVKVLSIQDQSKTVETLYKGATVTVVKSMKNQPGWYHVRTSSGKEGVCSGLYLKLVDSQSQTSNTTKNTFYTKDNLNLRAGAGTGYRILKTMPSGAKVTKLSESGEWYKVNYNGTVGYCSKKYLNTSISSTTNTNVSTNTSTKTYYVNTDKLNVRTGMGTSYSVYKKLSRGTAVEVLNNKSNGWSEIKLDNKKLYVSTSYLTTTKPISTINTNNSSKYSYTYSATTRVDKSSKNSLANVVTAFRNMGVVTVNPGEEFDLLKEIGKIIPENGFIESGVISNGQYSTGVGGGVCQASTTIHNAVMKAGLQVTERRSHSLPSKYVDKGLDAMITDRLNYKFKNTSKYPIRIQGYVNSKGCTVTIQSTGDITGGYTYEPEVIISSNGLKATTHVWKVKNGKRVSVHQTFYSSYRSAN